MTPAPIEELVKYHNIDKVLDFVFMELSEEEQFEMEVAMLNDDFLFNVIAGVFRIKRDYHTREKVKSVLADARNAILIKLDNQKLEKQNDQRPKTTTSD